MAVRTERASYIRIFVVAQPFAWQWRSDDDDGSGSAVGGEGDGVGKRMEACAVPAVKTVKKDGGDSVRTRPAHGMIPVKFGILPWKEGEGREKEPKKT